MFITLYLLAVFSGIAAVLFIETQISTRHDNAWLWAWDAADDWLYRRAYRRQPLGARE
jgi:hypothetical protein